MTMLALKLALARRLSLGTAGPAMLPVPGAAAHRVLAPEAAQARALVTFFSSVGLPGWSLDFSVPSNSALGAAL